MAKALLSKTTFENLVKHLVDIEEGKNKLLEQYFSGLSKERHEFEKLFEDYIKHIGQLIENASVSQTEDSKVPFVTIGSEVEIQDLSCQEVFKYRIVHPLNDQIKGGDVSYLSPIGRSLLLKKLGDEVEVKAPGGVYNYRIKSIKLNPE